MQKISILQGPLHSKWARWVSSMQKVYPQLLVASAPLANAINIIPVELISQSLAVGTVVVVVSSEYQLTDLPVAGERVIYVATDANLASLVSQRTGEVCTTAGLSEYDRFWNNLCRNGLEIRETPVRSAYGAKQKAVKLPVKISTKTKSNISDNRTNKIVFCIQAHCVTPALEFCVSYLTKLGDYVVVHYDVKSGDIPSVLVKPGVLFVPTQKTQDVEWGKWSQVEACLQAISFVTAENLNYAWFVYISGTDLPLCPIEELHRQLDGAEFDAAIEVMPVPENSTVTQHNRPHHVWKRYFKNGHPFSEDLKCYFGSQWWAASSAALQKTIGSPLFRTLRSYYPKTQIPDESFFQTLFTNLGLKTVDYHRFIVWDGELHPREVSSEMYTAAFRERKYWFTRKVVDAECVKTASALLAWPRTDVAAATVYVNDVQRPLLKAWLRSIPENITAYVAVHSGAMTDGTDLPRECSWVVLPAPFVSKTASFTLLLNELSAHHSYEFLYASMVDTVTDNVALLVDHARLDERIGVCAPLFFTRDRLNTDGQWSGMESQYMAHFEFLSVLIRTAAWREVQFDSRMKTGWATGVEYALKLAAYGWSVYKDVSVRVDHEGASTFAVSKIKTDFVTRDAYRLSGGTELRVWLSSQYKNDYLALLAQLAKTSAEMRHSPMAIRSRWDWFGWQHTVLADNKMQLVPPADAPGVRIGLVFHSLHLGGIERVWSLLLRELVKKGIPAVAIYWDSRDPSPDFAGLPILKLAPEMRAPLGSILPGLALTHVIIHGHSEKLVGYLQQQNVRVYSYLAGPPSVEMFGQSLYEKLAISESNAGVELARSAKKSAYYLPQPVEIPTLELEHHDPDKPVVLRVGRVSPEKGPELFGETAQLLHNTHRFLWVGGYEKNCEDYFKKLTEAYPNVVWMGRVSDRLELARLYRSATMSVVTSTTEGISNVVLESLMHGTPVITTRVGFVTEPIVAGSGVVLQSPTAEALAEAILSIETTTDKDVLAKESERLRLLHSPERVITDLLAIVSKDGRCRL